MKRILGLLIILQVVFALEYNNNYLIYPKFWNLYNGGATSAENLPQLKKADKDKAQWSATMKLNNPKVIKEFVGKTLYFITEYSGDQVARLAPTFLVLKNRKEYIVWWGAEQRQFISFLGNAERQIMGSIYIPRPDEFDYYAVGEDGRTFKVTETSPVTKDDIVKGLRTDWQHDIPGKYTAGPGNVFAGLSGTVTFKRFYLGNRKIEPLLDPERDKWFKGLGEKDKAELLQEFGIQENYVKNNFLLENQYIISLAESERWRKYYDKHKSNFASDDYFIKKNYIPGGSTFANWAVVADGGAQCQITDSGYVITNKKNRSDWTIIKIADINTQSLDLKGPVRLGLQARAKGFVPGVLPWQGVVLDIVQRDANGRELGEADEVRLTSGKSMAIHNIAGVFENEFIINGKAKSITVFLKIAGTPENDKTKLGVAVDELMVERVYLQKTDTSFSIEEVFSSLPAKPIEVKNIDGTPYVYVYSSGKGLLVGDRNVVVGPRSVRFVMKTATDYSGLYTNIFDISQIGELEMAADFTGAVKKFGNPQNWAANTIQIVYYDANGQMVYAADYGADRYPKIAQDPNASANSEKAFFAIPHERGAKYAQIMFHWMRVTDPKSGAYDTQNYYVGDCLAQNIIIRPALELESTSNIAAENGSFYLHRNGQPLSWTVKGVRVAEDLAQESRMVIFENTTDAWSSLKTDIDVPEEATALYGELNIAADKIEAGLAPWEGFGFFLEADVVDKYGATFHYSGIPVFQKVNDQLVRFERIPKAFTGKIEYYIPLYHENLKIKKLNWQIAFLGTGTVRLLPLHKEKNAPIVRIELLSSGQQPDNPAFWSQYALSGTDGNSFTFQKNYQLTYKDQSYQYQVAESLLEHAEGYFKKSLPLLSEIKKIPVNTEKDFQDFKVKALPSYARVEKEYTLEANAALMRVVFDTYSIDAAATFNFRAILVDKAGNTIEVPFMSKLQGQGEWAKLGNSLYSVAQKKQERLIPLKIKGFTPEKVRLVFGSYEGEVTFSDLAIAFVEKVSEEDMNYAYSEKEKKHIYTGYISMTILRELYKQKNIDSLAFVHLPVTNRELDQRDMVALEEPQQVRSVIDISRYTNLAAADQAIRNSIATEQWSYKNGQYYFAQGKPFSQVGFTIVGETFHKWYTLRTAELADKAVLRPYWVNSLSAADERRWQAAKTPDEAFQLFLTAQANIWQKTGINTIRVHQLFSSWSGLDEAEVEQVVQGLAAWQKRGFFIVFDLLPNTDFTGEFFGPLFKNKPYASALTEPNDLFKATLVLPEVRDGYVKPALSKVFGVFKRHNFWPNSLSYCNETGFTHGFWTIDKNNAKANPYFSRLYHYYYERYLDILKNTPEAMSVLRSAEAALQKHYQSVYAENLLSDCAAVVRMIKAGQRLKDNAAYLYYNVLRDDVIQQYPVYAEQLKDFRSSFKWLADVPAESIAYYDKVPANVAVIEDKLLKMEAAVRKGKQASAVEVKATVSEATLGKLLDKFSTVCARPMPDNYKIPENVSFSFIDSFGRLSERELQQVFFTSFVLPVQFSENLEQFIAKEATGRYTIGLNNDFTKDTGALLANAYLFMQANNRELRFNKYTHHPIGGHSMMVNPGYGNLFDDDSNIYMNLNLFTPPAGYPVQLSESNYTFVGDDQSGQGTWTAIDYLKVIAQGNHFVNFHNGPNNLDKPIINDYFNMGNRPYQVNVLGNVAVAALNKQIGRELKVSQFTYDRYLQKLEIRSNAIEAVAGQIKTRQTLSNTPGTLSFQAIGQRNQVNCLILKQAVTGQEFYVSLFGIERNNRQLNRAANPNLVQRYGVSPIVYEHLIGMLQIAIPARTLKSVVGVSPTGKLLAVPAEAYGVVDGMLKIDTSKTPKQCIAYRIVLE